MRIGLPWRPSYQVDEVSQQATLLLDPEPPNFQTLTPKHHKARKPLELKPKPLNPKPHFKQEALCPPICSLLREPRKRTAQRSPGPRHALGSETVPRLFTAFRAISELARGFCRVAETVSLQY